MVHNDEASSFLKTFIAIHEPKGDLKTEYRSWSIGLRGGGKEEAVYRKKRS